MMKQAYLTRMNQALDFIEDHLAEPLNLSIVADAASYSPYHFHRLFTAIIGEPLNTYINRRRLERAARSLLFAEAMDMTNLASDCGFNSVSAFSRSFKKYYGLSPSQFMTQSDRYSKIGQPDSKIGQQPELISQYIRNIKQHLNWLTMNSSIEVKYINKKVLAAVPSTGVNTMPQAFNQILGWASQKGLMNEHAELATVFHDSFRITSPDQVRMSIGIMVDEAANDHVVKSVTIPQGRYITGRFTILMSEFEQAWTSMFLWMNENGYQKSASDPYEIYYNDYRTHPEQKCICDLFIPIL